VATKWGEQAIGTLREGQQVLAYNPVTKKREWQPIVHVWRHQDDDLVDLTITTEAKEGKQQESEVIHTNKKHPFLTTEKGFVEVADLHVNMHVLKADGSVGVITQWVAVPGKQMMYNLEVASDHTFMVGNGLWVVHNACYKFNQHIIDSHLVDDAVASVKATFNGKGVEGVWNSLSEGEEFVNKVISNASSRDWVKQLNGRYALSQAVQDVPGRVVTATGTVIDAVGATIIMGGRGVGDLITAFPIHLLP
jgi:hypothetical protein